MNERATRRLRAGGILLGFGLLNALSPYPSNFANFLLSLMGMRYGFRLT